MKKIMTNYNYLWQANQDLSAACLEHPFVRGIADGSLAQNSFAYYVAQDVQQKYTKQSDRQQIGAFKNHHNSTDSIDLLPVLALRGLSAP